MGWVEAWRCTKELEIYSMDKRSKPRGWGSNRIRAAITRGSRGKHCIWGQKAYWISSFCDFPAVWHGQLSEHLWSLFSPCVCRTGLIITPSLTKACWNVGERRATRWVWIITSSSFDMTCSVYQRGEQLLSQLLDFSWIFGLKFKHKNTFQKIRILTANTLLDHWMNYKETRDLGCAPSALLLLCVVCVLSESQWGIRVWVLHAFISTGQKWRRKVRWVIGVIGGCVYNLLTSHRALDYWTSWWHPFAVKLRPCETPQPSLLCCSWSAQQTFATELLSNVLCPYGEQTLTHSEWDLEQADTEISGRWCYFIH